MSAHVLEVVESFVPPAERDAVRARLGGWTTFDLPHRARYQLDETHDEPELIERLAALASERLSTPLVVAARRFTRFRRGDYALFRDDQIRWQGRGAHVEVVADLSAAPSEEGQIVYAWPDGGASLPQRPGLVAVVDRRGRQVARYERYLGVRFGSGAIIRLGLVLVVEGALADSL